MDCSPLSYSALNQCLDKRATHISVPAGNDKATPVEQWIDQIPVVPVWLSFPGVPYDSGTMRFREAPTTEQADTQCGDIVKTRGTVVHKDVEGGFFAIEGDDDGIYDPINLPDAFKRGGLKVKVNARLRNDMGSIHMFEDIIEIVDIDAE